ncbi:MAG: hypothetical protein GC160_17145 [Acidobacteria bacterium]|nr:hypothetical protein [Acidobacteriota bacterium]
MRVRLTRPGGPLSLAAGLVLGLPLCNLIYDWTVGRHPGTTLLVALTVAGLGRYLLLGPLEQVAAHRSSPQGDYLDYLFASRGLRRFVRLTLVIAILLVFTFVGEIASLLVENWARDSETAHRASVLLGYNALAWLLLGCWIAWTLSGVRGGLPTVARSAPLFLTFTLAVLTGCALLFVRFAPSQLPAIDWFAWSPSYLSGPAWVWIYLAGVAFVAPLLQEGKGSRSEHTSWVLAVAAALAFVLTCLGSVGALLAFREAGRSGTYGWLPHTIALADLAFGPAGQFDKTLVLLATGILPIRLLTVSLARLLRRWTPHSMPWSAGLAAAFLGPGPWILQNGSWPSEPPIDFRVVLLWLTLVALGSLCGVVAGKRLTVLGPAAEWTAFAAGWTPTLGFILHWFERTQPMALCAATVLPYFLSAGVAASFAWRLKRRPTIA